MKKAKIKTRTAKPSSAKKTPKPVRATRKPGTTVGRKPAPARETEPEPMPPPVLPIPTATFVF